MFEVMITADGNLDRHSTHKSYKEARDQADIIWGIVRCFETDQPVRTLEAGEWYDTEQLKFVCWSDPSYDDCDFHYLDWFAPSGHYLGEDTEGCEPIFVDD